MGVETATGNWRWHGSDVHKGDCVKNWALYDDNNQMLIGRVKGFTNIYSPPGKSWCPTKTEDILQKDRPKIAGKKWFRMTSDKDDIIKNASRDDNCLQNWDYYNHNGTLVASNINNVYRPTLDKTKWFCPKSNKGNAY